MNKKYTRLGFTLAEILVWITIVWILALWIARIDINRLSQNQKSGIESIKIVNVIEEARNNALIWRWVLNASWDLVTPDSWSVSISRNNGWRVFSYWNLWAQSGSGSSWTTTNPFELTNLVCQRLSWWDDPSSSSEIILRYTWSQINIIWCSNDTYKKVFFNFWIPWNSEDISINSITGVIERD